MSVTDELIDLDFYEADSVLIAFKNYGKKDFIGSKAVKVEGIVGECIEVTDKYNIYQFKIGKNNSIKVAANVKA